MPAVNSANHWWPLLFGRWWPSVTAMGTTGYLKLEDGVGCSDASKAWQVAGAPEQRV